MRRDALLVFAAAMFTWIGCGTKEPEAPTPVVVERAVERRVEPPEEAPIDLAAAKLPLNATCSDARDAYHEAWALEAGDERKADLSRGQFGSVLARNTYFDACNVPERVGVEICAAVQNGRVLGATVRTSPRAPMLERCIDRGVRGLHFPVHPRLDLTTTVFQPSR
jgi:hypothetical protein